MAKPEKIRLGEVLIQQNLLTEDQLKQALAEQKSSGRKLGRIFIENGFVTEEGIAEAIARQLQIPFINLKFYNINPELVNKLPETQARRFRALVLEDRGETLLLGMADPSDLFAYDELVRLLKRDIDLAAVAESQLLQTIDRVYRRTEQISGLAQALEEELGDTVVDFGGMRCHHQSGRSAGRQTAADHVRGCHPGARFRRSYRTAGSETADPFSH